ncbi:RNA polymerase sigma factor SigF [Nocardia iowensis]|uniref:RNA polymerase sigma factor SigF n=1 Tax=Nocardia iowensis TaxID=204891 RepID=A0ABX8RGY7_NOCIO|nr:RNA polymerase sigma factor SigF [Nocardia iowensis]QXN88868.1 RNA polymerase sigma factor SigF [Nocardia iowensis]
MGTAFAAGSKTTTRQSRTGGDSYDNIEPWFDKLASLPHDDPHRAEVRDEIIHMCLPLAEHIACRYAGRGEEFDDLLQVARVGLLRAINRYDVSRGSPFLSFAVPTIMGEVRRHFRDYTWGVRVPRRDKELHLELGPAIESFAQRTGRTPTAEEIAEALRVCPDDVDRALMAGNAYNSDSIYAAAEDDTGNGAVPLLETLGAVDPSYCQVEDTLTARPLLADLPDEQTRVLVMRFFEWKTQSEIAEILGVSQMQVSRILSTTLLGLREQALAD